eukprot:bmy_07316T0
MKVLESLIGMIQKFPYDDPTYDKLHEDLDRIRGKFKHLCSLLNVQPNFKVSAESSGLHFEDDRRTKTKHKGTDVRRVPAWPVKGLPSPEVCQVTSVPPTGPLHTSPSFVGPCVLCNVNAALAEPLQGCSSLVQGPGPWPTGSRPLAGLAGSRLGTVFFCLLGLKRHHLYAVHSLRCAFVTDTSSAYLSGWWDGGALVVVFLGLAKEDKEPVDTYFMNWFPGFDLTQVGLKELAHFQAISYTNIDEEVGFSILSNLVEHISHGLWLDGVLPICASRSSTVYSNIHPYSTLGQYKDRRRKYFTDDSTRAIGYFGETTSSLISDGFGSSPSNAFIVITLLHNAIMNEANIFSGIGFTTLSLSQIQSFLTTGTSSHSKLSHKNPELQDRPSYVCLASRVFCSCNMIVYLLTTLNYERSAGQEQGLIQLCFQKRPMIDSASGPDIHYFLAAVSRCSHLCDVQLQAVRLLIILSSEEEFTDDRHNQWVQCFKGSGWSSEKEDLPLLCLTLSFVCSMFGLPDGNFRSQREGTGKLRRDKVQDVYR